MKKSAIQSVLMQLLICLTKLFGRRPSSVFLLEFLLFLLFFFINLVFVVGLLCLSILIIALFTVISSFGLKIPTRTSLNLLYVLVHHEKCLLTSALLLFQGHFFRHFSFLCVFELLRDRYIQSKLVMDHIVGKTIDHPDFLGIDIVHDGQTWYWILWLYSMNKIHLAIFFSEFCISSWIIFLISSL